MRARRSLRVLIGSGPTREPLDPVRFLSNYSTGYMGAQLAAEALRRGHRVTVVSGPGTEPLPRSARVIPIERADEMARAMRCYASQADAIVMAAAVADFRPTAYSHVKLPRAGRRVIALEAVPEILGHLPHRPGQVWVGFALESSGVLSRARRKLRAKRLDLLLAQRAETGRTPFGRLPVEAWLLERGGRATPLGRRSKPALARVLLDKTEALWYGQKT